ncbi:MAG: metallopeptidase family protein [Chloroflexi bacterium]|nr:metallopeptidase family protein [Chloroflexota bacterium]
MKVSKDIFENFVRDVVMSLPDKFLTSMNNVSIIVADRPTSAQMTENGLTPRDVLYGLYEGVPLPERGSYVPPLPDVITIFQKSIENASDTVEELKEHVAATVKHEIAHYFGFTDAELDDMGLG